jgi:hypothetical protein
MKLEPGVIKYLKGEAFRTSLNVEIGREKHRLISREAAITEMIKGKSVIHIGCSDHIGVIQEKIRNKTWLHKLITDAAARCIGIDIDRESIEYLKSELGYTNVYHGNILTDELQVIKENKWDFAVFGEIIEHIDDPVNFLKVFKEKFGAHINSFVITVPNIYNKRQFKNMLNYTEVINSDHRYWFTPYTISKILVSAGYNPEKIIYTNLQSLTVSELVIRKLRKITGLRIEYPFYYFNTLIITGKIN